MSKGFLRGHKIESKGIRHIFSDTGESIAKTHKLRPCGNCNKHSIKDGNEEYDVCLGYLPGLMNACCGHGNKKLAFIQFLDGVCIHGPDAIKIIKSLKYTKMKKKLKTDDTITVFGQEAKIKAIVSKDNMLTEIWLDRFILLPDGKTTDKLSKDQLNGDYDFKREFLDLR